MHSQRINSIVHHWVLCFKSNLNVCKRKLIWRIQWSFLFSIKLSLSWCSLLRTRCERISYENCVISDNQKDTYVFNGWRLKTSMKFVWISQKCTSHGNTYYTGTTIPLFPIRVGSRNDSASWVSNIQNFTHLTVMMYVRMNMSHHVVKSWVLTIK